MKSHVEKVTAAIAGFEATAKSLGKFGATDTEPMFHFHFVLRAAADGYPTTPPESAATWELYSGMPGNAVAASRLTAAARKAVKAIVAAFGTDEWNDVRDMVARYAWRVA